MVKSSQCPLWVMSRHSATLPGMSAPGGEADVNAAKADIAPRMSAIRGKADVWRDRRFGPLLAISGHATIADNGGSDADSRADLGQLLARTRWVTG